MKACIHDSYALRLVIMKAITAHRKPNTQEAQPVKKPREFPNHE